MRGSTPEEDRILHKVRSLLAKAEATTFAEEAEAFTAKAQELMAAHAIEIAMLGGGASAGEPTSRRLVIDRPYVRPKFVLLSEVARSNRCRAVMTQSNDGALGVLVGYPSDLDIVETLYTSLLLQATRCMAARGSVTTSWGQSRTRSFRASFLTGFAAEIGRRFAENRVAAESAASASRGPSVLPVLAARDSEVDRVVTQEFPTLGSLRVSVTNGAGIDAGVAAGATADIGRTRLGAPT